MSGEIIFPQKKTMELPERLEECKRYFKSMFPQGLLGGKGQSMRKFNGKMGKRCMLTEKQLFGEENISFSHYKDVNYLEFIMKDNLDEYSTIHILKADAINRRKESFEYIGGVPLDIDVHQEGVDQELVVSESVEKVMRSIENGLIPRPTLLIHTGRGMAIHYRYSTPVSVEEWGVHRRLWEEICAKVLEICSTEVCKIDRSVGDRSRVMRIPGTYNRKGKAFCYIIQDGHDYDMNDLADRFGINLDLFARKLTKRSRRHG